MILCIECSTHSPVTGVSLLLRVHGECVEAHGAVVVGHHPHIEVIELKREGKLLHYLKNKQKEKLGVAG